MHVRRSLLRLPPAEAKTQERKAARAVLHRGIVSNYCARSTSTTSVLPMRNASRMASTPGGRCVRAENRRRADGSPPRRSASAQIHGHLHHAVFHRGNTQPAKPSTGFGNPGAPARAGTFCGEAPLAAWPATLLPPAHRRRVPRWLPHPPPPLPRSLSRAVRLLPARRHVALLRTDSRTDTPVWTSLSDTR
jgi:hypothetical protein